MNKRMFLKGLLGATATSLVPVSLLASGYKKVTPTITIKDNGFDSEFMQKFAESFLKEFETQRLLVKSLKSIPLQASDTVKFISPSC